MEMMNTPQNEAEMNCFIFAKEYVRINMGLSSKQFPDEKILNFCKQKENKVKETKVALKAHVRYMRKLGLKRVVKIPLEKYKFGKYTISSNNFQFSKKSSTISMELIKRVDQSESPKPLLEI